MFPAAAALGWAVLVYIGIDFGFWGKVFDMSAGAERIWRASGEAILAATLLVFLFAYLNLNRWHVRYAHITVGWLAFLVLLIAVAYLASASPVPLACADTASMSSSAMQPMSGDASNPAPCKGMDQGRCTESCWSCSGGTSLPQLTLLTTTAWSSIRYPHAAQVIHGRIPAPLLGPPISRA